MQDNDTGSYDLRSTNKSRYEKDKAESQCNADESIKTDTWSNRVGHEDKRNNKSTM